VALVWKMKCSKEIINAICIASGLPWAREASPHSRFFVNRVFSSSFEGASATRLLDASKVELQVSMSPVELPTLGPGGRPDATAKT
jgi:hypothetical protein